MACAMHRVCMALPDHLTHENTSIPIIQCTKSKIKHSAMHLEPKVQCVQPKKSTNVTQSEQPTEAVKPHNNVVASNHDALVLPI
jgi:hypothetical protein